MVRYAVAIKDPEKEVKIYKLNPLSIADMVENINMNPEYHLPLCKEFSNPGKETFDIDHSPLD